MMKYSGQIIVASLLLAGAATPACGAKKKLAVNKETVREAVERGVAHIKTKQRKDGSWDGGDYDDGATALAVFALVKAHCPLTDPSVSGGVSWILRTAVPTEPQRARTYSLSLTALALSAVIEKSMDKKHPEAAGIDVAACAVRLRETADILVAAQHKRRAKVVAVRNRGTKGAPDFEPRPRPGGQGYDLAPLRKMAGGAWGYSLADTHHVDNSNTQFALLALRAAQNVGDARTDAEISIPREVWLKALARLVSVQSAGGEWDYGTSMGAKGFRDTMTAAGISGVVICISSLVKDPDVGTIAKTPEIRKAMVRLERQVYPPANVVRFGHVGVKPPNRTGYMFYSLERACMLGGFRKLGTHDWYLDGAVELLRAQLKDGSWSGAAWYNARAGRHKAPQNRDNTIETSFCLLFLTRAFIRTPAHKGYNPSW